MRASPTATTGPPLRTVLLVLLPILCGAMIGIGLYLESPALPEEDASDLDADVGAGAPTLEAQDEGGELVSWQGISRTVTVTASRTHTQPPAASHLPSITSSSSSSQSASPQARCGTLAERLECIGHTHPVFSPRDCSQWDCDPLVRKGFPFKCCMQPLTREEAASLLDGVVLSFVGDSTSRRANRQLRAFLQDTPFQDSVDHVTVKYRLGGAVIQSHWLPQVGDLVAEARRGGDGVLAFAPQDLGKRKVFVFGYSTHDFKQLWKQKSFDIDGQQLAGVVNQLSQAITTLRTLPGVDMGRDIFLVRLPIAQACESSDWAMNHCTTKDPVNALVVLLEAVMREGISRDHPDVGLLDVLSWTLSPLKVGRDVCTPADMGGTHFSTDVARMAYVQQVLHAVALLAEGRQGWHSDTLTPDAPPQYKPCH